MLEQEKQCSKQYSRSGAPIVATEPGYDTPFCLLSGRVSQYNPGAEQWEEISSSVPGGHVLLAQDSDELFTWVRGWSLVDGLSASERLLVPDPLDEERGGYYTRSDIGPGPFRFLDVEFTREQLLAVLNQSKSYFIGVIYVLEDPEQVTIHPTGGDFQEWTNVFFRGATPVMDRMYESLIVTLYRVNRVETPTSYTIWPELHVGYQRISGEDHLVSGPELLLPLVNVLSDGWPNQCWSPEELRAALTRGERKYLPGYFGLDDIPKLKKQKSRGGI